MIKIKHLRVAIIVFLAFVLRYYGLNWDQGLHLHPDERMLIMVADKINFFQNLNPDFFNYGSLPIYLLKGLSQLLEFISKKPFANYADMLYIGRYLSVFFDCLTVLLVYKIGRLLFTDERAGLLASFIYAIAFFPIQNAHFFTVDILLTCLTTFFIYQLLVFIQHHSWKRLIVIGIIFAAMMATKVTAIVFLPVVLLLIILSAWNYWKKIIIRLFIFNLSLLIFYFIFMPYAFLDYPRFLSDTLLQTSMSRNVYLFPYTLQFVGSVPYWHYIKQVFLWGLGPVTSILSLVGITYFFTDFIKKYKSYRLKFQIFFIFYLFYFIIIGASAVKFMRYLLLLYPFFAVFAGYGLYKIQNAKFKMQNHNSKLKIIKTTFNFLPLFLTFAFLLFTFLWLFMFINIYSQPHTRITATEWILHNIPAGSSLAVEYWDDYLPLYRSDLYRLQELHLYDQPDDANKWLKIESQLKQSDYIIIASNRLCVPIQKLDDCSRYKVCYPIASIYYRKLLHNELPFHKIKEFTTYPSTSIRPWKLELNDTSAEESFTVYDHPKIMIFKKSI